MHHETPFSCNNPNIHFVKKMWFIQLFSLQPSSLFIFIKKCILLITIDIKNDDFIFNMRVLLIKSTPKSSTHLIILYSKLYYLLWVPQFVNSSYLSYYSKNTTPRLWFHNTDCNMSQNYFLIVINIRINHSYSVNEFGSHLTKFL